MTMIALFAGTWAVLIGFFAFGLWPYLKRVSQHGGEKDHWTQGL